MTNQDLHNNRLILDFLSSTLKTLQSSTSINDKLLDILSQLSALYPACFVQIHLISQTDKETELIIPKHKNHLMDNRNQLQLDWNLQYIDKQFGKLTVFMPEKQIFTEQQQQVLTILAQQISFSLMIEDKTEFNQQYLLMQERSAMARELHDSIAQSLSCLKINLSCLSMQADLTESASKELLQTMKNEVNTAYVQLRDLITSFKFNINQPYLLSGLNDLIKEFNQKLKLNIELDYQLPVLTAINSQFIHLLQIIREALNNILKHAKATSVKMSLKILKDDIIEMIVKDDGIGLQHDWKKNEHYGFSIIQNRVDFLNGFLYLDSEIGQGVTIRINFKMAGINDGRE